MTAVKLKASLLPKQAEYVTSTAPVALYAGGVGAGKTIANVILAIKLALDYPGIDGLVVAPTYAMLRDAVMREFSERCPPQLLESFTQGIYPEAVFHPNRGRRSTIRFRAFDDAGKPKSITVGFVIVDEVTEMAAPVLAEIRRRIRQAGMPNFLRMTTNPDSKMHYVYIDFVEPFERGTVPVSDTHYIHTTTFENFMLPKTYVDQQRKLERTHNAHYMRSILGLWGDFDTEAIGAFEVVDEWSSIYRVAFIDSSFSDRAKSDRTAVAVVSFIPLEGRENLYWPIEFTGKSWEKSITNDEVINELLLFLDAHRPVESCLESQLGDSTKVFIDRFRDAEKQLKLDIKNHWTVFHQTRNKHERIMFDVAGNKDRIRVLKNTDPQFLNMIVNYTKGVAHEDEADSLAGAINQWRTSTALAEFIRRVERK